MQIALTGASGFVGRHVIQAAIRRGYEVVAFSRDPSRKIKDTIETRLFSLSSIPDFTDCEAVIHLAGENIAGLWTQAKVDRIRRSRIEGTRRVVDGIHALTKPPEVLVCASAIGFYGDSGDTELTETASSGTGFLAETCRDWEMAAAKAPCRIVHARIGMVLGKNGGALQIMRPLFRWMLGGRISSGKQWMSWIHVEDLASLLLFAVENLEIRGAVNCTSPWPVKNAEFTKALAKTLKRPAPFIAPAWLLKWTLRGFARELLDSKRVLPAVATDAGFPFRFSDLETALRDTIA
jgi:uncharacterized protein